jgi:peptidoglycan/LPS O-acetylase OafA/YrhL
VTNLATAASRRGVGLDFVLAPGAFRLVLAGGVVVSHLSSLNIGRLSVLLFFYLSGYWTARIWREKFGERAIGRYYAARYLRVWPLFFLATLLAGIARGLPLHIENLTLFGLASTWRDPTGVSWSLDIEVQFYLLLPLVVAFMERAGSAVSLLVALVVGVVGCWIAWALQLGLVAKYLPVFVMGALTFSRSWTPSRRAAGCSLAAFVAATALTGFTPFLFKSDGPPFDEDIYGFFWMLPLIPYVAHSLGQPSSRLDRHLGNLSFPLYLVHFPIIALAHAHFGYTTAVKLAAGAISAIAALLIYIAVDRPIDRLRVRLTEREAKPAN